MRNLIIVGLLISGTVLAKGLFPPASESNTVANKVIATKEQEKSKQRKIDLQKEIVRINGLIKEVSTHGGFDMLIMRKKTLSSDDYVLLCRQLAEDGYYSVISKLYLGIEWNNYGISKAKCIISEE